MAVYMLTETVLGPQTWKEEGEMRGLLQSATAPLDSSKSYAVDL